MVSSLIHPVPVSVETQVEIQNRTHAPFWETYCESWHIAKDTLHSNIFTTCNPVTTILGSAIYFLIHSLRAVFKVQTPHEVEAFHNRAILLVKKKGSGGSR